MNIIVTGSAGYIGSCICSRFLQFEGNSVLGIDDYSYGTSSVHNRLSTEYENFDYIVADLRKVPVIDTEVKYDAIIHLAGYKAPSESLKEPYTYYDNNVRCTNTVCELALKLGIPKIIFSSTAGLYSSVDSIPYTEEAEINPVTPYSSTKYISEEILKAFSNIYGIEVIVFRYFNPVGCSNTYLFGESKHITPINLMGKLLNVVSGVSTLKHLEVYGSDYDTRDGTCIRDYIHIMDLVNVHLDSLDVKLPKYSVFNIGTNKGTTVKELIDTFKNVNNLDFPVKYVDRRPGDLPVSIADISKANEILNYKPVYTLEDMCRDSWLYYTVGR